MGPQEVKSKNGKEDQDGSGRRLEIPLRPRRRRKQVPCEAPARGYKHARGSAYPASQRRSTLDRTFSLSLAPSRSRQATTHGPVRAATLLIPAKRTTAGRSAAAPQGLAAGERPCWTPGEDSQFPGSSHSARDPGHVPGVGDATRDLSFWLLVRPKGMRTLCSTTTLFESLVGDRSVSYAQCRSVESFQGGKKPTAT